jgi:hypothetical protein
MALNPTAKKTLQFTLLFSLGFLLIWLVTRQVAGKKDEIINAFKNANYFWIAIASLISILSHVIRAQRWNYLLNPLGYHSKWYNSNGAIFIGYFANYGIPRSGELSRCSIIAKYDGVPFEKALGTVITERIIDFILLIIIFLLSLIVQFKELIGLSNQYVFGPLSIKLNAFKQQPILFGIVIFICIASMFFLYLKRKKINSLLTGKFGNIIKGFADGLTSVKQVKNKIAFVGASFLIWLMYFLAQYVTFFAFDATSNLGLSECLVMLLFGTFGVIFTPGGLGAYQAILTGLLLYYHIDDVTAFAYPWLLWVLQLIVVAIIGTFSLVLLPFLNKSANGAK